MIAVAGCARRTGPLLRSTTCATGAPPTRSSGRASCVDAIAALLAARVGRRVVRSWLGRRVERPARSACRGSGFGVGRSAARRCVAADSGPCRCGVGIGGGVLRARRLDAELRARLRATRVVGEPAIRVADQDEDLGGELAQRRRLIAREAIGVVPLGQLAERAAHVGVARFVADAEHEERVEALRSDSASASSATIS